MYLPSLFLNLTMHLLSIPYSFYNMGSYLLKTLMIMHLPISQLRAVIVPKTAWCATCVSGCPYQKKRERKSLVSHKAIMWTRNACIHLQWCSSRSLQIALLFIIKQQQLCIINISYFVSSHWDNEQWNWIVQQWHYEQLGYIEKLRA